MQHGIRDLMLEKLIMCKETRLGDRSLASSSGELVLGHASWKGLHIVRTSSCRVLPPWKSSKKSIGNHDPWPFASRSSLFFVNSGSTSFQR